MGLFGSGERKLDVGLQAGWREMRWGDPPLHGMKPVLQGGDDSTYTLPTEELQLDGAPLDRVVYAFFQGRFSEVLVEISPSAADHVFKTLVSRWGKPNQPNTFIQDFHWENRSHGVEATLATFSRNPSSKAATLTVLSKYIKAKRAIAQGKDPGRL